MEHKKSHSVKQSFLTYLLENYALSFSEILTLESNEDFIYLSDLETYELYLISVANPGKVTNTWGDYKGGTCYKILQNRTEPCPFCTNHLLSQDQYYIWKHHNNVIDGDYILKDKLVEWEGKLVRMEAVMDISNPNRVDQVLRRSLDSQNLLLSCMKTLIEGTLFQDLAEKLLLKVCRFFEAEEGFFEYFDREDIVIIWDSKTEQCQSKHYPPISKDLLSHWAELLDTGKQVIIKNPEQLEGDAYAAEFMKQYNLQSFCITPVVHGKKLLGFIGIKNIKNYWTELSTLSMLGNHITVRMMREELQRENERIMYYDSTTGYLNFEGFKRRAEQILKDNPRKKYILWYSDLKKFKYINDACGYEVGDTFLRHWANSIAETMEEHETFGRISGDKFVVLRCYAGQEELEWRFREICRKMDAFASRFGSIRTELACGGYLMDRFEDRLSLNEMIDRANIAEKHIKYKPGNTMAIYDEEMRSRVVRELELEASLMEALEQEEFRLYLQPQVPLKESRFWCAEALVRWKRGEGEILYPMDFIGLFERDGMIPHLDHYMFEQSCRYIKEQGKMIKKPLRISVNVSRVTMMQPDFVEIYSRMKQQYEIPDECIGLEFTESVVVENHSLFRNIVRRLKEHGFWCAMDDFGADQSSLNVLKDIPIDILKLDRRFFDQEKDDSRREAVVTCILQLASALHMETIAEGVENMELAEALRNLGCDFIQGYVYSKPIPAEEFIDFAIRQLI